MVKTDYFKYDQRFDLEAGGFLPAFELCYSTVGELNPSGSNVIWVCHALTGNSNVLDWWEGLFDRSVFDPKKHFIICANMLGGCYGSTGPLSLDPATGNPYFHEFPKLTNRDIVRAFDLLRIHLGIQSLDTLIGGSMGGQQALEWAAMNPDIIQCLVGLASNARHSPWGIAFNESQRMAISADPTWSKDQPDAGLNGMRTARTIGMISYRSYEIFQSNQLDGDHTMIDFKAATYQRYQGDKLAKRFNAFTYWYLSEAMDSHNVGRKRGGIQAALQSIKARSHFIGIDTDILFPTREQQFLADNIPGATYDMIRSKYGHDGFLVETEKIGKVLARY